MLSWLQSFLIWHWVFIFTGAVGIVWAAASWIVYREPREKADDNLQEIDVISSGGGLVDVETGAAKARKPKLAWADAKVVLAKGKLWGIYLGEFCLPSTLWFLLTWFPTYLVEYRGMDYVKPGFMASFPFIAALVGVLLSGWVSDLMVKKGVSLGMARKLPIIGGERRRRSCSTRTTRIRPRGSSCLCRSPSSETASPRSHGRWYLH